MSREPFACMYDVRPEEREAFGRRWCGPAETMPRDAWVTVARYPAGDRCVEVACLATPARFWRVRALPTPPSERDSGKPGWTLDTGSGDRAAWCAETATMIAEGMLELGRVARASRANPRDLPPTPWSLDGFKLTDANGFTLATLETDGLSEREVAATGNLVAAAPDLLASLEAIVDCYGVGTRDPDKVVANLADFVEEARAAIARAKGGGA